MNPDRLVIRLAAINALSNFGVAPFPTRAGAHIFDSRIVPIEDTKADVLFPLCVVYTDYERDHWDHHSIIASAKKDRLLTVTFELLLAQITPAQEGKGYEVAYPATDSELETSLDFFEIHIDCALRATNTAADCWKYLFGTYENVISRRGATAEGGRKLAAWKITVECRVQRGPTNGTFAPAVKAFLDELEGQQALLCNDLNSDPPQIVA